MGLGEANAARGWFQFGQFLQGGLQFLFGRQQVIRVGRRHRPTDVGQKFKGPADVRRAFGLEEALFVLRIQGGGRVHQDAGAGGEDNCQCCGSSNLKERRHTKKQMWNNPEILLPRLPQLLHNKHRL